MKTIRLCAVINVLITLLVALIPNTPQNDVYQGGLIVTQAVVLALIVWKVTSEDKGQ